jgi:membrane peptidoglycan carboxypeptidase
VVEFGPAVYGITAASEYYFGRTPAELDVAECLFLSSLLPSPRRYGAMRDLEEAPESWMRGLRNLMRIAKKRRLLADAELEEGLAERVVFWHGGTRPPARPPVRQRSQLDGPETDDTDSPAPIDAP